ncbi:ABC transporter ATP-binding protein [Aureimonas sp. Leaf324]|jgi:peptide/nickel transport system ATP-binding protein|uniref:ABC transporter ATP-binding protein n=1 Tax=Aureimonas sp. Leaf324 TaxID=1736336 RepID=UPI0006FD9670|nr:ABC transporter ATP-binding protein [Aureimonas sp. Leaf324]KQQ86120.1 ABC transporter ATP-binding protein [Aureimonas sp. Leaf324]
MMGKVLPREAVAAAAASVLSVRNLTISVGEGARARVLVEALSFDLARGETLCIAGESGSGKSLTSLAIMGLLPQPGPVVAAGSIRLGEEDLTEASESRMRRVRGDRIAMIFQEPMTSLNPVLTVGRQLVEAIDAHRDVSAAEARRLALEALQAVRIPEAERRMGQYPHELSGGMRQRVMIAMALALEPDVLIADEPTTALDVTIQAQVLGLLKEIQATRGTALILITHDMGVVAEMADRVVVMRQGREVEAGAVAPLFAAPKEDYTRALLAAVPRMGDGSGRRTVAPQAPVAEVRDLQVRFPLKGGLLGRTVAEVHAVAGISFDVPAGATLSLVGESGCGKSTTAKAIAGLVPYEGHLAVGGRSGQDLSTSERKALRRDVQMIFQDPFASLDPRWRAGDLVAEPLAVHGIGSATERRERVAALFERVGLQPDAMRRYPHQFSGGQRQRICIARALALRPKLIIADESVSALDVSVQKRVLELLKELQAEFGIAYLFISHDMAVVENISDRVAVMYLGQIVETGTAAQIFGDPRHAYTRRLIEAVPVPDPARRRGAFPRLVGDIPSAVRRAGDPPARLVLTDVGEGHLVAQG